LKYWKLSPIFGQGIGFRWQADGLDYGGPVIYMHNIIAFVLMDFGIIGILYILFVVIGIFIMIVRTFKRKVCNNNYIYILFSSIIMAFIYANFFAVFRSIDFIVICSVLISMMINEFNAQKELRVNNEKTVI
jgi:O-antigen ligase